MTAHIAPADAPTASPIGVIDMSAAEFAKHDDVIISQRAGSFAPRLVDVFHRFIRWRAERNAIHRLSNLSDALLKDMGVTRGEISDVVRHGRPEVVKLRRN
jgi:uncharacterized protein YjiS (DUF1127 family)